MSLNATPSSERIHIGIFGNRNAGKSTLINAITNQDLAIVSNIAGTTTDPVKKAMELLPLGPVVLIDTPGLDDEGELGALRVEKSLQALNTCDIAILVLDCENAFLEMSNPNIKSLLERIKGKSIPYIVVVNKIDEPTIVPLKGHLSSGLGIDEDQAHAQYRDGNHKDRSQGRIHHKDKIGTHSQVERCPDQHSYDTDISHTKHAHIGRHTHDHRRDRILFDVFKTVFLNLGKHCRTDIADKSCRSDRREQTGKCTENRTQNSQQDHVHTSSPDVLHVAAHTIDALIDDIRHDKRDQCIDHYFRYRKNRAQKGRPPTVFCIFSKQSEHTINIITFSSKYSLFDIKKGRSFPCRSALNSPEPA